MDDGLLDRNRDQFTRSLEAKDASEIVANARRATEVMADARSHYVAKECAWYGELLERVPGARVLEIGAGNGQTSMYLLELGAAHVTALELAEGARGLIETAAHELGHADSIDVRIGDFMDVDLEPSSFDLIICEAVLHHIPPEKEDVFVARTAGLLAPSGMIRFSDPAVNSKVLDFVRWTIPYGRPSSLQRRKFAEWRANDVHPVRDNSTSHVVELVERHYGRVESMTHGVVARFQAYARDEDMRRKIVAFDERLPEFIRRPLAAWHGITAWEPRR